MTPFAVMPNGVEHVLVASPSTVVRQRVLESLLPKARRVEQASGGAEALVHLENGSWQVLFLDRRLPDLDAEELSETVRQRYPAVEVVMLDENAEVNEASAGTEPAAVSSNPWPDDPEKTRGKRCEGRDECGADEARQFQSKDPVFPHRLPGMVGSSIVMQSVYRMVHRVAPRDTAVLISGPTGTGKELIARGLHHLSARSARAFAVVNCAAIPETLLEAELFGYSRGAFTGAMQAYAGRIQAAHLGTLFLDEIGDMPLSLQPKLLRFLEQKELQRLGNSQVVRVDARVVAATNVDLLRLVGQGKFREDLYYRLSAFPIAIPSLAERPGDVVELAEYFLEKFSSLRPAPALSEEAMARLRSHRWPGNVREMQNVIERALILAEQETVIRPGHLLLEDGGLRARSSDDRTASSGGAIRAF